MTYKLVGVDGCKGKWLAAAQDNTGHIAVSIQASPKDLLEYFPHADVIAVDVPIGLTDSGRRLCDSEARALLGSPRRSSVFAAPIRPTLSAKTRVDASNIGKAVDGRGVGCQAWGIFAYVNGWDVLMRQRKDVRGKVCEVHPEVCFYGMNNNSPMRYSKKNKLGLEDRRTLLDKAFGKSVIRQALASLEGGHFALDDFYDAFAALWSARRIASRRAVRLPAEPPTDRYGLVMAIYY